MISSSTISIDSLSAPKVSKGNNPSSKQVVKPLRSSIKAMRKSVRLKSLFSRRLHLSQDDISIPHEKIVKNLLLKHAFPKFYVMQTKQSYLENFLVNSHENDKDVINSMKTLVKAMDDVSALNLYKRLRKHPMGKAFQAIQKEQSQNSDFLAHDIAKDAERVNAWFDALSSSLEEKLAQKKYQHTETKQYQTLPSQWENSPPVLEEAKSFYVSILQGVSKERDTKISSVNQFLIQYCKNPNQEGLKDFINEGENQKIIKNYPSHLSVSLKRALSYDENKGNLNTIFTQLKSIEKNENFPQEFRSKVADIHSALVKKQQETHQKHLETLQEQIPLIEKNIKNQEEKTVAYENNIQHIREKITDAKNEVSSIEMNIKNIGAQFDEEKSGAHTLDKQLDVLKRKKQSLPKSSIWHKRNLEKPDQKKMKQLIEGKRIKTKIQKALEEKSLALSKQVNASQKTVENLQEAMDIVQEKSLKEHALLQIYQKEKETILKEIQTPEQQKL